MSIAFALDGVRYYGIVAVWDRAQKSKGNDGVVTYMNYYDHVWNIALNTIEAYNHLQGLRGKVVPITTTDFADKTVGKTYTTAEVGQVETNQEGRRSTGVTVRFKVKVQ